LLGPDSQATAAAEGLRTELARDGIVVTTVCPGLMRNGSPRNAAFKSQLRAEYAWFAISDSLPPFAMNAQRAARRIIRVCKLGEAEVTLTVLARCAVAFHGLFPGLTADILGVVNRLLPGPGGIDELSLLGKESRSSLAPSWLTALTEAAAEENNEVAPGERARGNGRSHHFRD
jgi:hypothetical protein